MGPVVNPYDNKSWYYQLIAGKDGGTRMSVRLMVASDGPSDRPLREISMQTTGDGGITAITGVS